MPYFTLHPAPPMLLRKHGVTGQSLDGLQINGPDGPPERSRQHVKPVWKNNICSENITILRNRKKMKRAPRKSHLNSHLRNRPHSRKGKFHGEHPGTCKTSCLRRRDLRSTCLQYSSERNTCLQSCRESKGTCPHQCTHDRLEYRSISQSPQKNRMMPRHPQLYIRYLGALGIGGQSMYRQRKHQPQGR
jgi:hypothetical protein